MSAQFSAATWITGMPKTPQITPGSFLTLKKNLQKLFLGLQLWFPCPQAACSLRHTTDNEAGCGWDVAKSLIFLLLREMIKLLYLSWKPQDWPWHNTGLLEMHPQEQILTHPPHQSHCPSHSPGRDGATAPTDQPQRPAPRFLLSLSHKETKYQPNELRQRAELWPTVSKLQVIKESGAFPIPLLPQTPNVCHWTGKEKLFSWVFK